MKTWLSLAVKLAPIVLAGVPGIPVVLVPLLAEAITDAEQIAGATGLGKKQHVLATVTAGIVALNAAKGSAINPAIVATIVAPAIDTTIDVINAVEQAQTPTPTTPLKLVK